MKIELRPLRPRETKAVYDLFQSLPREENGFENYAFGLSEAEFAEWVKEQIDSSKGIGLKEGYVPQTSFILFVDGVPVGRSKLRHRLTPALEKNGGHIGYGIAPEFRGKGYANIILTETLKRAKAMGMDKVLLTINDDNAPSWKTAERNGGVLAKTEEGTRFYWITP